MNENKNIEKPTSFIFEGNISVKAAIEAQRRNVEKVLVDIQKHDKDTNYILAKAYENNILVEKVDRDNINEIAKSSTHGGLIGIVGERQYQTLRFDNDFYALVEGIEDPYNFAHVLRTLYAAGCQGVILNSRNWNVASDILVKTSAGASEKMEMYVYDDFSNVLNELKNHGYQIVCGNRKDAISLYEHHFNDKIVLCIGGEMRGLSKKVLAYSDINVYIPYLSSFKNALTSVSATSVIAFEYVRQKNQK